MLNFDGLTAETEYVVYVLLIDRGFNIIEAPGFIEFKTKSKIYISLDRYNAAFVTLRFV